jgi:hypothetical protein
VKVLGILMMIDEGEADWKVITIDAHDKWAPFLNDIEDVETEMPGMLDAIREWYRTYKIPDGKPPNTFGLGERFMDKACAIMLGRNLLRARRCEKSKIVQMMRLRALSENCQRTLYSCWHPSLTNTLKLTLRITPSMTL